MSEIWTKWEGQIINGVFPLRRFLGGSGHSGVFLTESKARNLPNAALKLIPANPTLAEAQLSHWTAAAALSHPHLLRLLEAGRCHLGGLQFLFVVMEYAEQNLSQILPQRALTPDEVREMLPPILAGLAFLHGKHLVQSRLKPTNILVVDDQLKLASDTLRPAGSFAACIGQPSAYDPPEASDGNFSTAGDIWSLGITVVEALTQHPPAWSDKGFDVLSLPVDFPPMFAGIVRRCLNRNPVNRPTVADLQAPLKPVPPAPVGSATQPTTSALRPFAPLRDALVHKVPGRAAASEKSRKQRLFAAGLAGVFVLSLAVWVGSRGSHTPRSPEASRPAPPEVSAPSSAPPADSKPAPAPAISRPSDNSTRAPARDSPSVLHEEIPDVPRSARYSIRGRIKVAVRVTVDGSGSVINAALESAGPSRYFDSLAIASARKWKFARADNQDSRKWLLRFEFSRGGASAHAATPRP
jgi:TonB family protein